MKLDFNTRIRILQLANHVAMIIGVWAVMTDKIDMLYVVLGAACYVWFLTIGTTCGLHRYFSHKSFKTNRFWQYVMGWSGTICTVGTILGWVGLHRYHHLHTDSEQDPHDPRRIGLLRAWFYFWKQSKFTKKFIRSELQDPMIVFMHRHYFKIIFAYVLLLAVIDPWLIIWCYCVPANGAYLAISALTVIGHIHGYTNYQTTDSSKNSWIANIFSFGEGWHNNHHAQPWNHRQGHKWWELDPPAWIIENILKTNK